MNKSKVKEFKLSGTPDLDSAVPKFEVRKLSINTEQASLIFIVTVPNGTSVTLDVSKVGDAIYEAGSLSVDPEYTHLSTDYNAVISGIKKYSVGIDADDGDKAISTDILIKIDGVTYYTLNKEHANPPVS